MTTDKDRSPHRAFGRAEEVIPPERAATVVVERPSYQQQPFDYGGNLKPEGPGPYYAGNDEDIARLPWKRRRNDEWTTPELRAAVLRWISHYCHEHPDTVKRWEVAERATAPRSINRLHEDQWYLAVRFYLDQGGEYAEVAINFPPYTREGLALRDRLQRLEDSMTAAIATRK